MLKSFSFSAAHIIGTLEVISIVIMVMVSGTDYANVDAKDRTVGSTAAFAVHLTIFIFLRMIKF